MEWYEHNHDHGENKLQPQETPDLSPRERLALRMSRFFCMEYCHLSSDPYSAACAAIGALFCPALGERAAGEGDEVIIICAGASRVAQIVSKCGGKPILLQLESNDFTVNGQLLEKCLSLSTRAVVVEHSHKCLENPLTVRNFCNKYDVWMLECVNEIGATSHEIDGKKYATGAIGDWSFCDLATLGISGGAVLTHDKLIFDLVGAHGRACDAPLSAESATAALTNAVLRVTDHD